MFLHKLEKYFAERFYFKPEPSLAIDPDFSEIVYGAKKKIIHAIPASIFKFQQFMQFVDGELLATDYKTRDWPSEFDLATVYETDKSI